MAPDSCGPARSEGWTNIITAAHVVAKADSWGESIRLSHDSLDTPVLLPPDRRLITVVDPPADLAIIGVLKSAFEPAPPPEDPIKVIPADRVLRAGVTGGWLGYPYMIADGTSCCFFSGAISAMQGGRYLIDGVAIEGVSGGPAFYIKDDEAGAPDEVVIIGSISEYRSATLKGRRAGSGPARCR